MTQISEICVMCDVSLILTFSNISYDCSSPNSVKIVFFSEKTETVSEIKKKEI
jgi:hypothetical protein